MSLHLDAESEKFTKQYPKCHSAILPRVVCSDRGPGFYQSSTGHIVGAYANAAKEHGFRPYAGSDASGQPPDVPDVLPHETAVAWLWNFTSPWPPWKAACIYIHIYIFI